jgi:hypothetical protein
MNEFKFLIHYIERDEYIDFSWDKPESSQYITIDVLESEWSEIYYLSLTDKIDEWCIENKIPYIIPKHYDFDAIRYIIFENLTDLLLFKLTWVGNV